MTLKESKDGTNSNGVRFFKKADLVQPTVDEKWDRVKIVCTQPFNKHVQYGLSFIVLHSSARQSGDSEEHSSTLGKFVLKKDDEDEQPSVGTWFAKRKDPPPALPPGWSYSQLFINSVLVWTIQNPSFFTWPVLPVYLYFCNNVLLYEFSKIKIWEKVIEIEKSFRFSKFSIKI